MTEPTANPWARWGWLMGGIWVVFLLFPMGSVLEADAGPVLTGLAIFGVLSFGALYIFGFVRMMRHEEPLHGTAVLAGLVAIALLVALLIGIEALGMSPFVVSFAMFAFRWPLAGFVSGAMMVAALLLLWWSGNADLWFFIILLPMIFGLTLLVRVLDHYGEQHQRLAQEMAIVSERERVARDVHDVLGHSLTAISVKAELASRLIDVDGARAAEELTEVQALAREALAEIRLTVAGLRATRIDDELAAARDSLVAAGIQADLPPDSDGVEVSNRIVLAWALREAVTNVIRHSGASHCVVTLGPDTLVVADDGVGETAVEGNGLRGLRERVAASGGTVTLGPRPDGSGHELRVAL